MEGENRGRGVEGDEFGLLLDTRLVFGLGKLCDVSHFFAPDMLENIVGVGRRA